MKYARIVEIENALRELGSEKLPSWYDIAKNIAKISRVTKEIGELVQSLREKYAKKDAAGQIVYEVIGEMMIPQFESDEDRKAFADALKKLNEDEFDVPLHKFPLDRLGKAPMKASAIAALLGDVITEPEEKKEPESKE